MSACILCSCQLAPLNGSQICGECRLLVRNLLGVEVPERWAPAVGIEDHIVSDHGRVARLLTIERSHRYPRVSADGKKFYVHTLVAEAFYGPRPEGLLVLHHDDDPLNPNAENLRFGDHAENAADARRNRAQASAGETGQEEEI
jgi:HNH endonuclease